MADLATLQSYEAELLAALGDPSRSLFFDHFKMENRPIAEVQAALSQIRREISNAQSGDAPRVKRLLPVATRAGSGL